MYFLSIPATFAGAAGMAVSQDAGAAGIVVAEDASNRQLAVTPPSQQIDSPPIVEDLGPQVWLVYRRWLHPEEAVKAVSEPDGHMLMYTVRPHCCG